MVRFDISEIVWKYQNTPYNVRNIKTYHTMSEISKHHTMSEISKHIIIFDIV
jgi:hypothetical protein